MSWSEIASADNSTPSIAPLNEYFLLNEYKTYGETGFLGNYPELLDIVAKSPLSLNDLTTTHRFLWTYANEHNCFGEMLGKLYDIPLDLSEYKTYTELFSTTDKEVFDAVAGSESLDKILTSSGNNYSNKWQEVIKTNIQNGNYFGYEHGYEAFSYPNGTKNIISALHVPSNIGINLPKVMSDVDNKNLSVTGASTNTIIGTISNDGLITSIRTAQLGDNYQGIFPSRLNITINGRVYSYSYNGQSPWDIQTNDIYEVVHSGDTIIAQSPSPYLNICMNYISVDMMTI